MENRRDAETVRVWLQRIGMAGDRERSWRERGEKVVDRYRDERDASQDPDGSTFNILWANTETVKPALYSARPKPMVRRRWRQPDKVAATVSLILERCSEFFMDTQDFDGVMSRVIEDYLLPGRALARVRYAPRFFTPEPMALSIQPGDMPDGPGGLGDDAPAVEIGPDGLPFFMHQGEDELDYEEVRIEYVAWKSVRIAPGDTWEDLDWIAFLQPMDRDELSKEFGAKGSKVRLDPNVDEERAKVGHAGETDGKAAVWEIWDKVHREVLYVTEGFEEQPLRLSDDPLGLKGFYPVPKPLYAVRTNDTLIPVPEFTQYQDQAAELDEITGRINRLVEALKVRGVYDAAMKQLDQLMRGHDNALIPVENWRSLVERGGLDGVVSWMPIEQIARTIAQLYVQREQLLVTIHQITGITDIQRGSTDPRETRGAQRLKSQFSSLRLRPRQDAVQFFVRDLVRLMSEIIAENFQPQTVAQITGIEGITPELMQLMRADGLREFAIDIETDTTIAADESANREQATEFIGAVVQAISAFAPMVQAGLMPIESAREIVLYAARKFGASRELDEALNAIGQQPQGQGQGQPDAAEQQAQQKEQLEAQLKAQDLQLKAQAQKFQEQMAQFNAQLDAAGQSLDERKQEHAERMDLLGITQDMANI